MTWTYILLMIVCVWAVGTGARHMYYNSRLPEWTVEVYTMNTIALLLVDVGLVTGIWLTIFEFTG